MALQVKSLDILIEGVLDNGLVFIGEYLEKILQRPLIIADNNGRVHFPAGQSSEAEIEQIFIDKSAFLENSEYHYQEAASSLFYRIESKRSNAYVIVKDLTARLVPEVVQILRESKLPVKYYFSKLNSGNQHFEKELADYLFAQSHANLTDILHYCDNEMELDRPCFVLAVQIEEVRLKVEPALVRSYVSEYLKREKLKAIIVCNHNQLALIIPVNRQKDVAEENLIDNRLNIYNLKQAIDSRFKITSSIGIGQIYPLINLEKSFNQARIAIILSHLMGRSNIIRKFSQLGIYQPVFSQEIKNTRQYCSDILGKLIEHDCKSEAELLPTLRKLLDACGNIKATADSLFIHVNTLYYRINKIEQILDTDLAKMDTRVELHTAIKVWDTLQMLDGEKAAALPEMQTPAYALQA